jgi:tRNA-uridine 2-sulfurtransferase
MTEIPQHPAHPHKAHPAQDPACAARTPAREQAPAPRRPLRVLAAMSGGVDSAVAAARAAAAGHDVTGVHLALSADPQSFRTGARGCCTIEDSRDARRAADVIGIPFYVWDLAERFREDVVEDFVAEYEAGRTPNPCLRCNEKIKFAALLDKALALGFDAVCTGHYARIVTHEDGSRELHRSVDMAKDQSYVLGVLDERQLAHAMFPLGDTASTKDEIRAEAERRRLAVAHKPDSHDICFIADGDTQGFLARRLGTAPGDIVDESGATLGTHEGAYGFTIGQRKGLRIGTPAPDGKPRYVLDISPVDNTVTVGPAAALDVSALTAIRPRWCGTPPTGPGAYTAQLRAHGGESEVTARLDGDDLKVTFAEPVRGVAPGQAIVLYDGTRVVGSATIATTVRARAAV